MKMNILTHAQTQSANFAMTSETTPKELISPAEVPKDRKLGTLPTMVQKESVASAISSAVKSTESIKDVKEVQNTNTQ